MKFSDYKRLGKISIKSRKKSTKNTVRGISFGLILLVSVIFLTFAMFGTFNAEINKIRTLATFILEARGHYDASPSIVAELDEDGRMSYNVRPLASYSLVNAIKDREECTEFVTSSNYSFNYRYPENKYEFSVDGKAFVRAFENSNTYGYKDDAYKTVPAMIKICNLTESTDGKYILDAEREDMGDKPIFVAGDGFTKSTNGKGEIIISESFAKDILKETSISSLVGKELTLRTTTYTNYTIDDDDNPSNDYDPNGNGVIRGNVTVNAFTNFKIVGVLNQEFFALVSRGTGSMEPEPNIWISDSSYYYLDETTDKKEAFVPIVTQFASSQGYDMTIYTYPQKPTDLQKTAEAEQLFFPYVNAFIPNSLFDGGDWGDGSSSPLKSINMFQGKSFAEAVELSAVMNSILAPVFPGVDTATVSGQYQNDAYYLFNMMFNAFKVVLLILYVFGGVLFITSLLNLYNSINYSVQARRNYMGIMRAIGAHDNVIPKMYFVEMVLIFMKTLIWVLIFSFGISFGLRALVSMLVKQAGTMLMGMNLALNLVYYPLALGMVYGVMFIIAIAFATVACKSVSKKPILDVLRTDV